MNPNSSNLDRTGDPPKDAVGWGRLRDQSGIALLVALIVVVLMVTLVVEFDYGTRASLNTAATFRDGVQAMYLAKSGVAAARAVLVDDATTSPLFNTSPIFALLLSFVFNRRLEIFSKTVIIGTVMAVAGGILLV